MVNFNSDKGEIVGPGLMIGFVLGEVAGALIWYGSHDNHATSQTDLAHLQLENEQIQTQLNTGYTNPDKLVLNDGQKTFSFDMSNVNGTLEMCMGKYELKKNTASVVGNISCTQIVLPKPTPTQ